MYLLFVENLQAFFTTRSFFLLNSVIFSFKVQNSKYTHTRIRIYVCVRLRFHSLFIN